MKKKISIIIPTKNGQNTIQACLESIFSQSIINNCEVIIIDSGSEDKTLEIAKNFPVKIYQIKPEEFGHGRTRNLGVNLSQGEFVFFTVQDARLENNKVLEALLTHFKNSDIKAVGGIQIVPHEKDKNPIQWFRPIHKPDVKILKPDTFFYLSNKKKFYYARLDDVVAMYRKEALIKLPFDDVEYGEDLLWANKALAKGWKIVIDSKIRTYHYHHYTIKHLKNRIQQERKLASLFGIKYKHFTWKKIYELFKIFYLVLFKKNFVPDRKIYWLLYNIKLWIWKKIPY